MSNPSTANVPLPRVECKEKTKAGKCRIHRHPGTLSVGVCVLACDEQDGPWRAQLRAILATRDAATVAAIRAANGGGCKGCGDG
jgi:hypothetical protein